MKKLIVGIALVLTASTSAFASAAPVKSIVLVHGAFADGSGWQPVATILKKDGYDVSVVQEPETSLADDVKATDRLVDMQAGSSILVGHSYGGTVITEAGNDPKVAGLVYVAAFQPDAGESTADLNKKTPPAATSFKVSADGFVYLDPAKFHADFCADLPTAQADFMSTSQVFTSGAQGFGAKITTASWKSKPTWAVVAKDDRAINPELERFMYKRSGSKTVEIKASHAVYVSHAREVAKVIEEAAQGSGK